MVLLREGLAPSRQVGQTCELDSEIVSKEHARVSGGLVVDYMRCKSQQLFRERVAVEIMHTLSGVHVL